MGCQGSTTHNNIQLSHSYEFSEPSLDEWATFIKPIREYMYYRTQAVLVGDVQLLWDRYPRLAEGSDINKGINAEKHEIDILNKDIDRIDANYQLESYSRLKIFKLAEDRVVVLVHGDIVYTTRDFDITGGELLIEIELEKVEHQWTVVKTDEYTIEEYKAWLNNS